MTEILEEKEWGSPEEEWAPLFHTKRKYKATRGPGLVDFARQTMTFSRGFKQGEPLTFTTWQSWLVNCLLEEKPNGFLRFRKALIGLPRKNGKSLVGSSIAILFLFYGNRGTEIYSAASSREQAKIVFNEAKAQVAASALLSAVIEVRRDFLRNRLTGAIYKALSADAMTAQGLAPEVVIFDEVHALRQGRGEELWSALTEGSGDRPESLCVGITTAGANKDSLLGGLYDYGVRISEGAVEDDSFGFFWWGASEDADVFDEETWKRANPNLAIGLMDLDDFRSSLGEGKAHELASFERYRLNKWVRVDGLLEFFTPAQIKEATKPGKIKKGASICVGFDGSVSEDSTGFIGIDIETGLIEILASWERDYTNPEWAVPRSEVLAAKKRIFEEYNVLKMWCDPAFFQSDVEQWVKESRRIVERIPQSNSRMIPMTQQLKIDVLSGSIFLNGSPALASHFMNAVERENGKVTKDKSHSKRKIDFLVCAILANGARNQILNKGKRSSTAGRYRGGSW